MSQQRIEHITEYKDDNTSFGQDAVNGRSGFDSILSLAANIVGYLAGLLMLLLGFRFVLALLSANPGNWFASFIYDVSHPFVSPFFSLFNYQTQFGTSRFESYTLVAMIVYAVIAYALIRLITLGRQSEY